jgi:hypothetical protein
MQMGELRQWVLVITACLLNAHSRGWDNEIVRWSDFIQGCISSARDELERIVKGPSGEVLFGVCELLNWVAAVLLRANISSPVLNTAREPIHSPIRGHISNEKVLEATKIAKDLGICQNHLWNLAVAGGNEKDIPILVQIAAPFLEQKEKKEGISTSTVKDPNQTLSSSSSGSFRHPKHDECTAEFCYFSDIDNTSLEQLHKCPGKNCDILTFPTDKLNGEDEHFTWWIDDVKPLEPYITKRKNYVAISHVWSDGTGAGVKGEGRVNRCLFEYFREAAKDLGCEAIWWDTVCIPKERKARKKALGRMNQDFSQATYTLVHDEYLVNFPWAEDGTPCLALVLSPWFTRAWTALELLYSEEKRVRVIYRDPDNKDKKVIKDLDTEILANTPASWSRSHLIASSFVDNLRKRKLDTVSSITSVLRTRNTSKPRDQMIIASLLAGKPLPRDTSEFDMPAQITKCVLRKNAIESSFLFHGRATMAQKGGFSWCPFSLLNGPNPSYDSKKNDAYVDGDGAITTTFWCRELLEEDVKKLRPYSLHMSVDCRISGALEKWMNCLLLWQEKSSSRALLVTAVDIGEFKYSSDSFWVVECHYVGTVDVDLNQKTEISVRIGCADTDPHITAKQVLENYSQRKKVLVRGSDFTDSPTATVRFKGNRHVNRHIKFVVLDD